MNKETNRPTNKWIASLRTAPTMWQQLNEFNSYPVSNMAQQDFTEKFTTI